MQTLWLLSSTWIQWINLICIMCVCCYNPPRGFKNMQMLCGTYTREYLGEKTKLMGKWRSSLPLKQSVFLWRCSLACLPHWAESLKEKWCCLIMCDVVNNSKWPQDFLWTCSFNNPCIQRIHAISPRQMFGTSNAYFFQWTRFWVFWTIYGWSAYQTL